MVDMVAQHQLLSFFDSGINKRYSWERRLAKYGIADTVAFDERRFFYLKHPRLTDIAENLMFLATLMTPIDS